MSSLTDKISNMLPNFSSFNGVLGNKPLETKHIIMIEGGEINSYFLSSSLVHTETYRSMINMGVEHCNFIKHARA